MKKHTFVSTIGTVCLLSLLLGTTALASCPCGEDHDLTVGDWEELSSTGGVLESGNYYLEQDVQLETDLTIASGANVHLCLNDCVLHGTGTSSVITVETWADEDEDGLLDTPGGILYLYDKAEDLTKRYGHWDDTIYEIASRRSTGDTTLLGGIITGGIGAARMQSDGTVVTFGGGINVRTGATAHIFGGTIAGNYAQTGGGVMISGDLTIDAGTIVDNYAQFGGGINNSGLLVKTAGEIYGNVADVGGGVNNVGACYLSGPMGITDNLWIQYQEEEAVDTAPNDIALWRLANPTDDDTCGLFLTSALSGQEAALYVIRETDYPLATQIPVLATFEDYTLTQEDVDCFALQNPGYIMTLLDGCCTMDLVDAEQGDGLVLPGFSFVDVTQDEGYYNALVQLYDQEIFFGTSETTFSPDAQTSRGMLATLLHRLSGEGTVDATLTFEDVSPESSYLQGIAWVNTTGLMQGYSESIFAPDDPITTEQLAVILYRYVLYQEIELAQSVAPTVFLDQEEIASWALEGVSYLQQAGVFTQETFSPQSPIARSDMAVVLMQFLQASQAS